MLRLQLAPALCYNFEVTVQKAATREIDLAYIKTSARAYFCGPCCCPQSVVSPQGHQVGTLSITFVSLTWADDTE